MNLAEAGARADELASAGDERGLADLRARYGEEVDALARSSDYRERAAAYRAIGQLRFRQRLELLRRGLEDESPACRGSALLSLELLSRDHPGVVNSVRSLLHELATSDGNAAVRRLAVVALRNGSPERYTILVLNGIADDDEQDRELRAVAKKIADALTKKSRAR